MTALLLASALASASASPPRRAMPVRLLDPAQAGALRLKRGGGFAVSAVGTILLQTEDNLYDLDRRAVVLGRPAKALESFGFAEDGALLTISSAKLGFFGAGGLQEQTSLPGPGMRLAPAGADELFLYGKVREGRWALYHLRKGGSAVKLFDSDEPITAAAASPRGVYLAVGDGIYLAEPGRPLAGVHYRKGLGPVRSLAHEPVTDVLFFSTDRSVYAVKDGAAGAALPDVGGLLQLQGGLYVYDSEKFELVYVPWKAIDGIGRGSP